MQRPIWAGVQNRIIGCQKTGYTWLTQSPLKLNLQVEGQLYANCFDDVFTS